MEKRLEERLEELTENPVQWGCCLAPFTSFGIGGPADGLVQVESGDELSNLLRFFSENSLAWRFIGRGSNLLVSDSGFSGVILLFGKTLSQIELLSDSDSRNIRIRAGAGCSLAKLQAWCTENSYSGLEFAAGIPGSLGGAVVMNAGAWGGEIADIIDSISVISLRSGVESLGRNELDFRYRMWGNQGSDDSKRIVLSVDISLKSGKKEVILRKCREYMEQRKAKQPKVSRNAGSFFKNPEGDSAGRLIEASGLKGRSCGGAMVSPVHANFLVNTGKATANDVYKLMAIVVRQVKKDSGVQLLPEVHFL
jgi:UDP-N-acetylmuramate dehydrogenase